MWLWTEHFHWAAVTQKTQYIVQVSVWWGRTTWFCIVQCRASKQASKPYLLLHHPLFCVYPTWCRCSPTVCSWCLMTGQHNWWAALAWCSLMSCTIGVNMASLTSSLMLGWTYHKPTTVNLSFIVAHSLIHLFTYYHDLFQTSSSLFLIVLRLVYWINT